MNMQSVNLLLLSSEAEIVNPIPPHTDVWIDNLSNSMITNEGNRIVFKTS